MQLENIVGTCSMATLVSVNKHDLRYNFKDQFDMLFRRFQNGTSNKKKVVLYNTNYSWFGQATERRALYNAGFRKVGQYKGSAGTVYIMVKKIK